MAVAEATGADVEIVRYLKNPLDRSTLEAVIAVLEDPVADLVRKDATFKDLGLDAGDYVEPGPVVDLLLEHPKLMQRPILWRADKAIIGRPKDRMEPFLRGDRS